MSDCRTGMAQGGNGGSYERRWGKRTELGSTLLGQLSQDQRCHHQSLAG